MNQAIFAGRWYSRITGVQLGTNLWTISDSIFRQWATNVLRQFAIRGSLLDSKRMENYGKNYLS